MEKMQHPQSRKSSSWWWDSHISPKNSKWLSENLEEMETQIKETLELIEEGESSEEKAGVLITHVQNFHQMYRALAERYGNVTGELRKNIPSSLQSHVSSGISESDSEAQSPSSPEPDLQEKMSQQKQKPQSDCFDVSIGSGASSDVSKKGSDGSSSSSESDLELDEVKEANDNSILYALSQKIIELEDKLREVKGKLDASEEKNSRCQCNFGANSEVSEHEEKQQDSDVETKSLLKDLDEVKSEKEALEAVLLVNKDEIDRLKESMVSAAKQFEVELAHHDTKIDKCNQELEVLSEKYVHDVSALEAELGKLQGVIKTFEDDFAKISHEKSLLESRVEDLEQSADSLNYSASEMVKLQELLKNTQAELERVSQEKEVLRERAHEFEQLFRDFENSGMEVAKLPEIIKDLEAQIEGTLQEKSVLQDRIKELEQVSHDSLQNHSLEKSSLSAELSKLSETNASLEAKLASVEAELRQVYDEKAEQSINSEKQISGLNQDLANVKSKLELLSSEKSLVNNKVATLLTDVTTRDEKLKQMDGHLSQLQLERAKLMSHADLARKSLSELHARVCKLEQEVEMQKLVISESAEGKREAIRQLCFSLEHYRSGYQELRQLLHGQKRPLVMAT
ncbi:protein NETWORKED 4B-like [Oryza brachyantha]|uniref:protein NETWORKED 4B-like n=1 Tax=Oryza brachyantha TaxID=4533 RepID=UPI0003EA896E|nr:protein NETWORKED 4B-like [Oryza brachyantha]XP_040380091.1 protein NETWORKED 4B-like [Oryza brachyantha]